ncbi:MAG: sensor histidine kinase [Thermoleophilia bacterium]
MIAPALAVGAATLAVGVLLALLARRLPSLRLQLGALALLAVLLPLGAVLLSGALMFSSGHDLTILAAAAGSGIAALAGALLVARTAMAPVERVQEASGRIAAGDLSARAPEDGPAELANLGAAFNHMAGELERLFDARRQLIAHASHDLRTPLASLQAMIEALEDGLATPGEYLPGMHAQVRHLSGLVDDLFELARIDAGALTLELEDVSLEGVVEGCVRGVVATAGARGVRVEMRVDGRVPPVRAAADQVERVLLNLLTNALRHTPSDGSVAVRLLDGDEGVCVSVEDDGEGIAPADAERVFERFWRADDARRRDGSGAGLGLAIARGLVEAQGGRIWAEARDGGGARVSFILPHTAPGTAQEPARVA